MLGRYRQLGSTYLPDCEPGRKYTSVTGIPVVLDACRPSGAAFEDAVAGQYQPCRDEHSIENSLSCTACIGFWVSSACHCLHPYMKRGQPVAN